MLLQPRSSLHGGHRRETQFMVLKCASNKRLGNVCMSFVFDVGEFLGYRLAYRPRDKGPDSIQEVYIRDPNIEVIRTQISALGS